MWPAAESRRTEGSILTDYQCSVSVAPSRRQWKGLKDERDSASEELSRTRRESYHQSRRSTLDHTISPSRHLVISPSCHLAISPPRQHVSPDVLTNEVFCCTTAAQHTQGTPTSTSAYPNTSRSQRMRAREDPSLQPSRQLNNLHTFPRHPPACIFLTEPKKPPAQALKSLCSASLPSAIPFFPHCSANLPMICASKPSVIITAPSASGNNHPASSRSISGIVGLFSGSRSKHLRNSPRKVGEMGAFPTPNSGYSMACLGFVMAMILLI